MDLDTICIFIFALVQWRITKLLLARINRRMSGPSRLGARIAVFVFDGDGLFQDSAELIAADAVRTGENQGGDDSVFQFADVTFKSRRARS